MTAPIFLSVVTSPAAPGRMESSRTHLTQPSSWGFAANVHVLGRQETGKGSFIKRWHIHALEGPQVWPKWAAEGGDADICTLWVQESESGAGWNLPPSKPTENQHPNQNFSAFQCSCPGWNPGCAFPAGVGSRPTGSPLGGPGWARAGREARGDPWGQAEALLVALAWLSRGWPRPTAN